MIPEQYWTIIRRWFWLVALLGVAGGAAGVYLIPMGLGNEVSTYNASVTLGVSRLVSVSGAVATAGGGDEKALADYTRAIADKTKSPQYLARLRETLADEGLVLTESVLRGKLTVTSDEGLFRVGIETTAGSAQQAELVAQEAADAVIEDVAAEEKRIRDNLVSGSDEKEKELLSRLATAYQRRLEQFNALGGPALEAARADLARRVGDDVDVNQEFSAILQNVALVAGDTELAAINAEVRALEDELASLYRTQQDFSLGLLSWGEPVFILNPVDTVALDPTEPFRRRDMLVLGGGAGLVMGWIAANMAEHIRNGRAPRREETDE